MASMDEIGQRIFTQKDCWARVLLGGLMCLTVIGAPFALGYLFRYAYQVRSQGKLELPPWEDWGRQYVLGLMFLGVWALWFLLPVVVACLLSLILTVVTFGIVGMVAWLPLSVVLLLAPGFFVSALMHYQRSKRWSAIIEVERIWQPLRVNLMALPAGGIALAGICALGMPLFPFAFFLGFLVVIPYYLVTFIQSERNGLYN